MDKVKSTLTKIIATWSAIGATLIALGVAGINFPPQIIELFSQDVANILEAAFNAGIAFYGAIVLVAQVIRGIFIAKEDGGEVSTRNSVDLKKIARSPFKL